MITRIEYQSLDGRCTATVLWIGERRWHVTRRASVEWSDGKPVRTESTRPAWAKTMTKAQAIAREWVGR